jgi:hypothetical protein
MSISVNLILATEQRSGSKINPKSALRVVSLVVPLLLLLALAQQGIQYFFLRTNLSIMESRWEAAEPRQKFAKRQVVQMNQNLQILDEIQSWQKSSPAWDAVILTCMQATPEEIQVTTLRMQAQPAPNQVEGGSPPLRVPNILIEGVATEPGAMISIQQFQKAIEQHPLLADYIDSANVVNFAADPSEPETNKRVFTIRIVLVQMPEKEA